MSAPRYPMLFRVSTRVPLSELSAALGRATTLAMSSTAAKKAASFTLDGFG
jgi:hypothetical protein